VNNPLISVHEPLGLAIRSLVGETDGKAQRFVDAYERVIH
jgi:hypothetical protein